ncbi:MAG: hypothetical protein RL318_936 [Fibrobacterota bacterium]|jgi:signal transduction histidine kinase
MFFRNRRDRPHGWSLAIITGWIGLLVVEGVRLLSGGWNPASDSGYEAGRTFVVALLFTALHRIVRLRRIELARTAALFSAAMWMNFAATLLWGFPTLQALALGLWAVAYIATFVTIFLDQPEVLQPREGLILRMDTFLAMAAIVIVFGYSASHAPSIDLKNPSHLVLILFAILDLVIFWGTVFRLVTIRQPRLVWVFRWRCFGMLLLACADFSQAAHLLWGTHVLPSRLMYLFSEGAVLLPTLLFVHAVRGVEGYSKSGVKRESMNPILASGLLAVLSVLLTFWILAGKHIKEMGVWVTLSLGVLLLAVVARLSLTTFAFLKTSRTLESKFLQLEEANRRAEALQVQALSASDAKSLFLARMSHEIRTPLNAILGYAQLLRGEFSTSDQGRNGLQAIHRSGEHLLSLLNDILEMSRIEAGKLELREEDFDLLAVLDALESMFRLRANEKGLEFRVVRASNLPARFHGDQGKLRQILTNLLGNAVKYTDKGWIELRAGYKDGPEGYGQLEFSLEDTGCGLTPKEQEELFKPFEQRAGGLREGGSGLGLSISRELALHLGGELVLQHSHPGLGSLFLFTLKLKPALARTESSGAVISGKWQGGRLLVVDDQSTNRDLLREFLEGCGWEVREAVDGLAGLEVAQEWLPDVVLLDMQMPRMNGLELTRALRAKLPPSLGIVAITAGVFSEDREALMAAGADAFVGKPFRLSEVRLIVEDLLSR